MSLPVDGFTDMLSELRFNQPRIATVPVIRFLSADEVEVREAARKIHRRFEHVIRIGDKGS